MEKGFSYTIEDEKIKKYMKFTTEQKLEWLEEINEFTQMMLSEKQKLMRNQLRSGEF